MKLLLATRNAHKTREFAEILGNNFALEDLHAHPEIGEIAENGATFLENAQSKALAVSRKIPGWILADDSGLEVDSLGGAPGIFSARYAGAGASDEANRQKLLAELAGQPNRCARYVCALVLAENGKVVAKACDEVRGEIIWAERGASGFGYDAIFQPNESRQTFAEISPAEKNRISHRGRAARKMRRVLEEKFA